MKKTQTVRANGKEKDIVQYIHEFEDKALVECVKVSSAYIKKISSKA
jgi:hypothetical protein